MKTVLSVLMTLYMILASLFGGLGVPAADLQTDADSLETNPVVLTAEQKEFLTAIRDAELEWLASTQLENGAIPMTGTKNGTVTVNPYFADFAALALLDDADRYADAVKKYADWHFAHLNTAETDYNGMAGTIYDYEITLENGAIVSESIIEKDAVKSYDSTDSYAAVFLTVLQKYCEKTGDTDYILANADAIAAIADAMLGTFHFGLTFAKPDYEVKFLMDNCEVYEGCVAAVSLLNTIAAKGIESSLLRTKCEYAVKVIAQTVESALWNQNGGYYEVGIFKNGLPAYDFTWDEFYPCATAQLFPIMHGLLPADSIRANNLYNAFCAAYDWQNFDIPSEFCWSSTVYTAAKMHDIDSVMTYMQHYAENVGNHAYPLYNADIAKVALAANHMLLIAQ